jgi:hypothetical protein
VPIAHQHRLEESPGEAIPLGRVRVVPGGAGVEQVTLQAVQDLRAAVDIHFCQLGHVGAQRCPASLILALREVAQDEQVGQAAELPLEGLALPVALRRLGAGLVVGREDPALGPVRELEAAQVAAELSLDDGLGP